VNRKLNLERFVKSGIYKAQRQTGGKYRRNEGAREALEFFVLIYRKKYRLLNLLHCSKWLMKLNIFFCGCFDD
jgi:hypothetical protein